MLFLSIILSTLLQLFLFSSVFSSSVIMSSPVLDEAARIAQQFEYPTAEVKRGVAEYIRQMEEGLAKEGTTLSQIPTFVTEVPNGTEKVCSRLPILAT